MSQIFLFTGQNAYLLQEEKRRWVSGFSQKHGEENLVQIPAKGLKYSDLLEQVSVAPFIAESRLVVIDGIPKLEKEEVATLSDVIHPQVIVVFVEPKPDKRLSATKALLEIAETKTFNVLKGEALVRWIMEYASSQGTTFAKPQALYLIDRVGEDQMLLSTELLKLCLYKGESEVTRQDIDTLIMLSEERTSWMLMDLIAAGNTKGALQFLNRILQSGQSAHALWNQLLWIVAQISLVSAAYADGKQTPPAIAKEGVPFPTAKTLLPFVRSLDQKTLSSIVEHFADADTKLKTGGFKATEQAPEELFSLLDSSIAKLATI